MLQTHNNTSETQEDIIKRLAELTKWQEEQKKILAEKQTKQRQILGYEQRNMYQVLGLLHHQQKSFEEDENGKGIGDGCETTETTHKQKVKSAEIKDMIEDDDDDKATTGYYSEDVPEKPAQRPKRTFLKRGQGLKQRFKVDPDEFRLDKLPRYKFANAHPNLRKIGPKNTSNAKGKSQLQAKKVDAVAEPPPPPLDAQEKRFQQLLISSNNVCNSTPDSKANTTRSPKVRFAELPADHEDDIIGAGLPNSTLSSESNSMMPPISWAKVLDSQQIKPIGVQRIQIRSKSANTLTHQQNDEENLSIFELIEQKANDGTIDMNSSCIKRFMDRKSHTKSNETDDIPVDKSLEEAGLKPIVREVLNDEYSSTDAEDDHDECETTKNSDHSNASSSRSETPQKVRVRFSDQNDTHEYIEETASETADENTLASSADLLQQFKEALFSALQCRADQGQSDNNDTVNNNNANSSEPIPQSSTLSDDLQEKAALIKERLAKLEKEIDEFKENNLLLTKAKQEHELEKAQFQQERIEAMDRLNDEKIQMEIYLHDERMKIEEDKRKLEQQMRLQKSTGNKKERTEIVRLNQELELTQVQLKQKDQTHAAAQARLRTQIRNFEKDQKQLYDDIEQLNKEKKRLEMENWKLGRENNNKMLQEINRNIAKLAPKLSPVNCTVNEEAVRRSKKPTVSVSKSVTKFQTQKAPRQISKATATSRSRNATKEPIGGNLSSEFDSHNSLTIEDANDEDDEDDDYISKELHATADKKHNENSTNSNQLETSKQSSAAPIEFKREIINSDGSKDIWYPNGNLKKISADAMNVRMLYFNKDIKETNLNEGTVKYYYAETNTWHTTYLDGLEILEFPNGQTEHRHKNGTVEIHFANNSIKVMNPADEHTLEEWRFADGTNLIQMRNGDKVLMFPNGQKEVHTKLNKRREYPDGTVKLVYPDGSHETRYSNGRVRLKDKDGKLIMDTEND